MLQGMTEWVRRVNIAKGWRKGDNTFGDYCALLHSEISEALEAYRDHRLEDATEHGTAAVRAKPEGVGSELADVLIRLLDMADVYGINLDFEFDRKMRYNEGRPHQHGGRTLSGPRPATPKARKGSPKPVPPGPVLDVYREPSDLCWVPDCGCDGGSHP